MSSCTRILIAALAAATSAGSALAQVPLTDSKIMSIHDNILTLDTHIDIGAGYGTPALDPAVLNRAQVNLPSMRAGGLDAGFFIVYTPQGELNEAGQTAAEEAAEEKYRGILRMLRANQDTIGLATTAEDVKSLNAEGKLVALIGIENSSPLGTTADQVRQSVALWAERGARYASITHFGHNQFGGSSNPSLQRGDGEDPGLSELGRVLVTALNDHGIMVDISHVGPRTAAEAMEMSRAPLIASHSTVYSVHANARGLSDEQLEAIRDDDGVAQITAFRSYLAEVDPRITDAIKALRERLDLASSADRRAASPERLTEYTREVSRIRREFEDVTLDQFLDHVDHAVEVAGIDHVGMSGDFDGGGGVQGWDGAADTPNVTAALLQRGYSAEDLEKLWSGNLLRVMTRVQEQARQ